MQQFRHHNLIIQEAEKTINMSNHYSKDRIKLEKNILHIRQRGDIKWKDIKHIEFEDEDEISIGYDEGYYSENNSWDPHHYAIINRMVDETDEQWRKRLERNEKEAKRLKDRRYQTYLSLKKEFEPK